LLLYGASRRSWTMPRSRGRSWDGASTGWSRPAVFSCTKPTLTIPHQGGQALPANSAGYTPDPGMAAPGGTAYCCRRAVGNQLADFPSSHLFGRGRSDAAASAGAFFPMSTRATSPPGHVSIPVMRRLWRLTRAAWSARWLRARRQSARLTKIQVAGK